MSDTDFSNGINKVRQFEPAGYLQNDVTCNSLQNTLLNQRDLFLKSRKMPLRFEFTSPYTNKGASYDYADGESRQGLYTQSQLDMRRKAEILQYNKTSSSGNQLTKAQKYAKIVSGPFQRNTQTVTDENGEVTVYNLTSCETDKYVPTSTTKSNVPGKPIMLYYDKDVPLYNYGEQLNNSDFTEEESDEPWKFTTASNIFLQDNIDTTVFFITVGHIDNAFTYYNVTIPIALYIEGNVNNIQNQEQEAIKINALQISIMYGDSSVNASYSSNADEIMNQVVTFNTSTTELDSSFKLTQYIGNLNINNLRLSTQYGFTYFIKVKINVNTNTLIGAYSNLSTGAYSNILFKSITTNNNVNIVSPLNEDLPDLILFNVE